MKILFLSFTCEDIGVAMVTNMISQLQESFPLRPAAGSFEISSGFAAGFVFSNNLWQLGALSSNRSFSWILTIFCFVSSQLGISCS